MFNYFYNIIKFKQQSTCEPELNPKVYISSNEFMWKFAETFDSIYACILVLFSIVITRYLFSQEGINKSNLLCLE